MFNEPYQSFLNLLTSHPPTPLTNIRKKPVPPSQSHTGSITDADAEPPEFSMVMEKDEADRLEVALKAIVAETDKMRSILIAREKELEMLKKQMVD